jgi:hypothetical protein
LAHFINLVRTHLEVCQLSHLSGDVLFSKQERSIEPLAFHAPDRNVRKALRDFRDPVSPGCSVSIDGTKTGAIGCFAKKSGAEERSALTAAHVATDFGRKGSVDLWQPNGEANLRQNLGRTEALSNNNWAGDHDVSAFKLGANIQIAPSVLYGCGGPLAGLAPPSEKAGTGSVVRSLGPGNGHWHGEVQEVNGFYKLFDSESGAEWAVRNAIFVRGLSNSVLSKTGDSGSPLFCENGFLHGFVVGGHSLTDAQGFDTIAVDAEKTLASLGLELIL